MPLITFKTINQQSFEIDLDESATIGEVKQKISNEKGERDFPVEGQKLIYNGKVLDDATTVGSLDIVEKKFVVVMVTKRKEPAPTPASADSYATVQKQSADGKSKQPSPESTTTADVGGNTAAQTAQSRTVVQQPADQSSTDADIPQEHQATVENIQSMGYPREEVIRALRAAFFDADRAVEYLCNGIPEGLNLEEVAGVDAVGEHEEGGGDDADTPSEDLSFLQTSPQFHQLREMIRNEPSMLQQIIQQIADTNPALMRVIQNNQAAFLQLLNSEGALSAGGGQTMPIPAPAGGASAVIAGQQPLPALNPALAGLLGNMGVMGGAVGGGGQDQPQVATIPITAQDHEALQRLRAMGFPEPLVLEAFFACDKNEDLAVNYILQRMEEFSQGPAPGGN